MAGSLGKGASLNLQPSVNGAIDYVVAGASHLNWAEPSDKAAVVEGCVSCECAAWGWEAHGNGVAIQGKLKCTSQHGSQDMCAMHIVGSHPRLLTLKLRGRGPASCVLNHFPGDPESH